MRGVTILAAVLVLLVLASPAIAEVITLKDGTVLIGKILEGDEKGIRLQRFDTGGVVFLPWNFLIDRDASRIRKDRGLDIGELEIFQVPGVRIELTNRMVYEGVIASQEADRIVLHAARTKIPIPLKNIVRKEAITVNAVDVFPPETLYQERMKENPPDNVEGHFEAAKFCIQIELYNKAIVHLGKVQELDPEFKPDFVQARLNECQTLEENKATTELFNSIVRLLYANRFSEAIEKIDAMKELEGLDEVWKTKLDEKKKEAETKREVFYIRSIASLMPRYVRSVAEAAGKDQNLDFKNGRRYAYKTFTEDLYAKLMSRFELDKKELRDFISKIKSYHQIKVSYGSYTWFARGERPPRFKKVQNTRQNNQRGRLNRRASQNQKNQQQKPKELPKQDELWARGPAKLRANYLHGTWAERSRDVHVVRIDRRPCSACGGRGSNRITGQGGIVETRCWRCRGIASDRVAVYRIGPGDGKGNVSTQQGSTEGLTPAQRLKQKLLERAKRRQEEGGGDDRGGRSGGRGGGRGGWGGRSR